MINPAADQPAPAAPAAGEGTWVVLPTYDEAENLPGIATAILAALPAATLLVVDDGSPDGTGELAESLAAADDRVRVPLPTDQGGSRSRVPRRLRDRDRRRWRPP